MTYDPDYYLVSSESILCTNCPATIAFEYGSIDSLLKELREHECVIDDDSYIVDSVNVADSIVDSYYARLLSPLTAELNRESRLVRLRRSITRASQGIQVMAGRFLQ